MAKAPQIQSAPIEAPQTIGFLIAPQFSMLAFVSAVEPLRVANRLAGRELYRWSVISRDGQSVTASNGMSLLADRGIEGKQDFSLIVVCAGFEPERRFRPRHPQVAGRIEQPQRRSRRHRHRQLFPRLGRIARRLSRLHTLGKPGFVSRGISESGGR